MGFNTSFGLFMICIGIMIMALPLIILVNSFDYTSSAISRCNVGCNVWGTDNRDCFLKCVELITVNDYNKSMEVLS